MIWARWLRARVKGLYCVTKRKKVGVLISGNGSNLQALIDACQQQDYPAEIAVVISNKNNAFGLTRAAKAGIPCEVIDHRQHESREAFDDAMHQVLERYGIEFICLAGFMRLLSAAFVRRWQDRMINIHPSLLPAFKGISSHRDAIAAGVRVSGCTVHFVRTEMDVGPIIIQAAVPVQPQDTPETLGARVLEQEHICYPQALKWLAEGRLSVQGQIVQVKENTPQNPHKVSGVLLNPSD
jgi:phosphoribosylglycinamide formyltransferase-1